MKGKVGMLKNFLKDESGATAIEYGLIAALISVALIGGARAIGTNLDDKFTKVGTEVNAAGTSYLGD